MADEIRLVVFTAADLSGQRAADRASRKLPARRKNQIDPLELTSGDPVVRCVSTVWVAMSRWCNARWRARRVST